MIELRDAGAKAWALSGLATTWSYSPEHSTYFVADPERGTFLERIERNAFSDATSGREHVELLREHAPDSPSYAATDRGTMRLVDDTAGLVLGAALSKSNPESREAVRDIRAGILKGLSIGFKPISDNWTKAADGRTELRSITKASLFEVSMVRRPANHGAAVLDVRHETRSAGIEYRSVPLNYRDEAQGSMLPHEEIEPCPTCGGTGMVGEGPDRQQCPDCKGTGAAPAEDRQVIPPNLRAAKDPRTSCLQCRFFDPSAVDLDNNAHGAYGECERYDDYPVKPSWWCSSFASASARRRVRLVLDDSESLKQLARTYGVRW